MANKFILFGTLGWCIEILWTGLCSLLAGDLALTAKTYLWMFPIYGMTSLLEPLFLLLRRYCPIWLRCCVYILSIFTVEFLAGALLRHITGVCPWDYSGQRLSVLGLIRLDYTPLWAMLGLFFEEVCATLAKRREKG